MVFRSNTSPNTLLTVNLTSYRNDPGSPSTIAYARVDWSVTTSSATYLGTASNRTLQIFNAWGTLLGSGVIKNNEYWGTSTTHSGSFTIQFDPGTHADFVWPLYVQVPGGSSDPCVWTNRSYCPNFDMGWPKYWSYATAATTLEMEPVCFENNLRLKWSGATNGINNGISTYHCYYQYSDDGYNWTEVGVDSNGYSYIDINTSSWPRGRLVRFRVYAISYNNPCSSTYGNGQKNRLPNALTQKPLPDKNVYVVGDIINLSFSPNSIPDPDNNLVGYEVGIKNDKDELLGLIASKAITSAPFIIEIDTKNWQPGKKWRFVVRGYDALGTKGEWSPASDLIMIGVSLKLNVGGQFKDSAEALINVNEQWKQIGEMNINVNGEWKALA